MFEEFGDNSHFQLEALKIYSFCLYPAAGGILLH
jgi:hypothetical protein